VNTKNILALADYIEKDTTPLSFSNWSECIAGKCCQMLGQNTRTARNAYTAGDFLGIDSINTISKMFFPDTSPYIRMKLPPRYTPSYSDTSQKIIDTLITRKAVVSMLRNYVLTGNVDWQLAIQGPTEINTAKPPFPVPALRNANYDLVGNYLIDMGMLVGV
jgi:hypothetical protein